MTPNPNSPQFIRHEVPEYAWKNSKKLAEYFVLLRELIEKGQWQGISKEDIFLTYNTYDGRTKIEVVFKDSNSHSHHFIMQLMPDNGFGDIDAEDTFSLTYLFEGVFDNDVLSVRSFSEYLSYYLAFNGFEPTLINCDKGISKPSQLSYIYKAFCQLIDITLSVLKPIEWFYTKEPQIKSYADISHYFTNVLSLLKQEADKGRRSGISSKCFSIDEDDTEEAVSLNLIYRVNEVWDWHIYADAAWCGTYTDLFINMTAQISPLINNKIRVKLNTLFANFIASLTTAKGSIYIGSQGEHSVHIQYFKIDDTMDILCSLIDDVVTQLKEFNLQLPLQPAKLTEEIEAIKEQMETALNTTFRVITDEEQINSKLQKGYFLNQ